MGPKGTAAFASRGRRSLSLWRRCALDDHSPTGEAEQHVSAIPHGVELSILTRQQFFGSSSVDAAKYCPSGCTGSMQSNRRAPQVFDRLPSSTAVGASIVAAFLLPEQLERETRWATSHADKLHFGRVYLVYIADVQNSKGRSALHAKTFDLRTPPSLLEVGPDLVVPTSERENPIGFGKGGGMLW